MLKTILIALALLYLLIGVTVTAFCVHMSYHESASGFGDDDDRKAQRALESRFGLGLIFFVLLFLFWPLAILIAFYGARNRKIEGHHGAAPGKDAAKPAHIDVG